VDHYLSAYLSVVGAIWIASLGFPVPEDIALLTGGYLCHQGYAKLSIMIPVSYLAVLSGDLFCYILGRRWASNLLEHRLTHRMATPERIARLKQQFLHHQLKTVFIGRFLPGLRMLVLLTAGAVRMKLWKFVLINGIAISITVPVFIGLGYLFSHSFAKIKETMAEVRYLLIFALCLSATIWLVWHFYSKKAQEREEETLIDEEMEEPPAPAVRRTRRRQAVGSRD
jgi:membrane protein DedA with SNARE-associated domain